MICKYCYIIAYMADFSFFHMYGYTRLYKCKGGGRGDYKMNIFVFYIYINDHFLFPLVTVPIELQYGYQYCNYVCIRYFVSSDHAGSQSLGLPPYTGYLIDEPLHLPAGSLLGTFIHQNSCLNCSVMVYKTRDSLSIYRRYPYVTLRMS